ncbi:unnamed protein product [Linum tenue]|uniref:Transposase n=1 Tax=Linum tenue TaxID=586396 RepID=A0AAV0RNC4_9ROSI|nr:unnamed protein product [Linum tenue]
MFLFNSRLQSYRIYSGLLLTIEWHYLMSIRLSRRINKAGKWGQEIKQQHVKGELFSIHGACVDAHLHYILSVQVISAWMDEKKIWLVKKVLQFIVY